MTQCKVVAGVAQCKVVTDVTHGVEDEGTDAGAWAAWTTLCCGSVYCLNNHNSATITSPGGSKGGSVLGTDLRVE